VHAAASRFLSLSLEQLPSQAAITGETQGTDSQHQALRNRKGLLHRQSMHHIQKTKFELLEQDFNVALQEFVPLAMRGVMKAGNKAVHLGWEDVGGLYETRTALEEVNATLGHLCL
jgi:hypothetical protein